MGVIVIEMGTAGMSEADVVYKDTGDCKKEETKPFVSSPWGIITTWTQT